MILGLDVSHHQGAVNFAAAKSVGRDFVVLKATEGVGYTDPNFATYRANAHAAGMIVGFYHFAGSSSAKRVFDPTAEADAFTRAVGSLKVGEFVALDFEPFGYTNLGSYDMVQWAKTWLDRVTASLGVRPLIYMSGTHLRGYNWTPIASTHGLWYAVYDQAPTSQIAVPYWGVPAMKQYYDKGSVLGVAGTCDVNAFYGTTTQLLAYGKGGSAPTPTPVPTPKDTDMRLIQQTDRGIALVGPGYFRGLVPSDLSAAQQLYGAPVVFANAADFDTAKAVCTTGVTDGFGRLIGEVHGKIVDSVFDLSGRPGSDSDDLLGQVLSTRAEVRALAADAGQAVNVDAVAVANALAASDTAIDKLADAIAAKIATRLGNG